MSNPRQNIIIAVTGASGSIYARNLLDKLVEKKDQLGKVAVIFSKTAIEVWNYELDTPYDNYPFTYYKHDNFFAAPASGSALFDTMIVIPCSMGTLGRIAHGLADDLIARAAEVTLKQRRKLIMVTRETPLSLISIQNLEKVTLAGGIICPANPSFYSKPENIEEVVDTVVNRVLDLADIPLDDSYRWGEK
jgi:flavin prenyltransferase